MAFMTFFIVWFKMRSIVKAEVLNFQEDKAFSMHQVLKNVSLLSPTLFCLEQSWWTDVTSYSAAKMWTKIEDTAGKSWIAGLLLYIHKWMHFKLTFLHIWQFLTSLSSLFRFKCLGISLRKFLPFRNLKIIALQYN